MKRPETIICAGFCFLCMIGLILPATVRSSVNRYNVIWNSPGNNSGESMPCGGGDIGMNVWVEKGDLLFYFSRSGAFDENNTLLKQGRIRIRLTPNPFEDADFRQELNLEKGRVEIRSKNQKADTKIQIRADVLNPVIYVSVSNEQALKTEVFYENWRYRDRELRKNESNQNSYKWAAPAGLTTKKDFIDFRQDEVIFYHRNEDPTLFDVTVRQQGMESVKDRMFNPLQNLIFGGIMKAEGLKAAGTGFGEYAYTDYQYWKLESPEAIKQCDVNIYLHTDREKEPADWEKGLKTLASKTGKEKRSSVEKRNLEWWKKFQERSFIITSSANPADTSFQVARNYQLFRYMLACNAYGKYPTKFNGGLFTYDPGYVDTLFQFTPDFRKWGGGTHTAQNQRLVYFPMLKSGDTDMMKPQFDFYLQNLGNTELRSRVYWDHEGACFTEQLENFGLPNPSEYGWKRPASFDKGMEYNAWLEYQWDTVLEFCFMILENERYTGISIASYLPLIESSLRFFDEHYQYLAAQRGNKKLDERNHLVLYPGSACETYKMATNATSTIAALKTVIIRTLELSPEQIDPEKRAYLEGLLQRIPEIRTREIEGHRTISPAWLWERVNNTESPQLYPVFPWGMYGIGRPDLDVAINTWNYDPDVIRFRSHVGWKQDAIWAARLGLTAEAKDLVSKKLADSGRKFPAFWGPGFDWTPDHNHGGSGMIALQEMLMQTDGKKIILLPAWPAEWDVHFKLHAPYNTTVECKTENGKIVQLKITPEDREKDLVRMTGKIQTTH